MITEEFRFRAQELELSGKSWRTRFDSQSLPLVALHGWMDNAATFDRLIPALDYAPCYAPDFSGHGLSAHRPASGEYYIWTYAEEVLALLDAMQFPQCVLMGHSMGGGVACIFAALFPERVKKLVLLDAMGPLVTAEQEAMSQMRQAMQQKQEIYGQRPRHYPSIEEAARARAKRGISLESAHILAGRGVAEDSDGFFWRMDRQLQRRTLMSMTEAHVELLLEAIKAPTLLVGARQSKESQQSTEQDTLRLERRMGSFDDIRASILDGNHFQHLEGKVEDVAALVRDFIA